MSTWLIEPLAQQDRAGFDCGDPVLNAWIRTLTGQHTRSGLCRVYVLVRPPDVRVLGYYSLSASKLVQGSLPSKVGRKIPAHLEVPAILLGRLAVDLECQNQGIGGVLLVDAFRRVVQSSEEVGVMALTVHANGEKAAQFYLRNNFVPLQDDPHHLF